MRKLRWKRFWSTGKRMKSDRTSLSVLVWVCIGSFTSEYRFVTEENDLFFFFTSNLCVFRQRRKATIHNICLHKNIFHKRILLSITNCSFLHLLTIW